MLNNFIVNFLKGSDEYAKILIIIWLKLRDIYLEEKSNEKVSLNKRVESLRKFCRTIRKRCQKANKLPKFSRFLKSIEVECQNSKEMLYKLSNITSIMRMFDIPKPIEDLIDTIGLGNPEDNEFANVINELFEENIELNKIDEQQIEEGTLVNYVNRKYDKHTENAGITQKEESKVSVQNHNNNVLSSISQTTPPVLSQKIEQIPQVLTNFFSNNINLPQNQKNDIETFINNAAAALPDFQIKQLPGYMNSQISFNKQLQKPSRPEPQQIQQTVQQNAIQQTVQQNAIQQTVPQKVQQNPSNYTRRMNTFEYPSYNRARFGKQY